MSAKAESPEVARVRHLLASRSDYVIGIDEVGMGALAGPVVVGAVVVPVGWYNKYVKDSKKYTNSKKVSAHDKRRRVLEAAIKPEALYYCHAKLTSKHVDELGIRDAWLRCMWVAATKCLRFYPDAVVVVDGDSTGAVPTPNVMAIPGGDSIVAAVSAASVLAKVERDRVMRVAAEIYPMYGFHRHVGYGTSQHMVALKEYGPCPMHRQSYSPVRKAEAEWQKTRQHRSETPASMP